MYNIVCRNVNQALNAALLLLSEHGVKENSRNGEVLVLPEPAAFTYTHPLERVLFAPARDANPFFHLMESLWLLAGRNDIAWPTYFNKNFAQYTDDGVTHPGAYGYRWRNYFGYDQLQLLIKELKQNPDTRRAVLTMWDGGSVDYGTERITRNGDLARNFWGTKDVPCNTHVYFDRRGGPLNMTVCQRSGDLWWGTLGANFVQFSMLQEYLAAALNTREGEYRQFCNNLHAYTSVVPSAQLTALAYDAYEADSYPLPHLPLINTDIDTWESELYYFLASPDKLGPIYENDFFLQVARPAYLAWAERKQKVSSGMAWAHRIGAPDWRQACVAWIKRREK